MAIERCNHDNNIICDKCETQNAQTLANRASGVCDGVVPVELKILHMTLKKKWFDLIASGQKTVEYREDKPYWRKRLIGSDGMPKDFDVIHFRNGYGKKAPLLVVEYLPSIRELKGAWNTLHGEVLSEKTLALNLGRVLRVVK